MIIVALILAAAVGLPLLVYRLSFLGFEFDTLTPEEAARHIMSREVTFRWQPQIVELVQKGQRTAMAQNQETERAGFEPANPLRDCQISSLPIEDSKTRTTPAECGDLRQAPWLLRSRSANPAENRQGGK